MKLITINDTKNPYLKIYHQLRDNAFTHDNSFIADSPKVVNLLLEQDIEIKSILATQSYYDQFRELILSKNIPMLFVADKKIMESIVGHKIHHNVMMHGIRPKQVKLEDLDDNIIMLDIISSTENIGSIARSAAALGVNSYLTPSQAPHPYGRRAIRVSMGYISMLKTHIYDDIFSTIQRLKEMGYTIFGAEITSDSIALSKVQIPEKWVLLMGHEGKGLSQEVIEICDILVEVEMVEGIKSFNVGVAASILMYQFRNKQIIK
jgi:tRNA G18 (ribose-2'-O)-methylase SpoU